MKNFYFLIILLFPLLIESQDSFSELDKSQMESSILYDRAVKVANLLDHSSKINATYFRQAISELGQADYDSNFNAHLNFKSIEDDRIPPMKGRVRATCHIMAMCCKPDTDSDGNDITHCMLVTNVDINGLVPKWIVNASGR